jgi:hypothetical protein
MVAGVLAKGMEKSDAGLKVLSRAHSTDVAMQATQDEGVAHAWDGVSSGLEGVETALSDLRHEV